MSALKGRIVWITGAGTGIGRAIAHAFAGQGAHVALTGRREEKLNAVAESLRSAGATVMTAPADVTDPAHVTAAHTAITAAWGDVDVLINNAGGNAKQRHWRDLSPADMAAVVDVNLAGPFLCSLAVLPAMRARRDGLLIHIASLAGTAIFPVSGPAYIAAKHGARAMSQTINAEEGIHGIRSVCINPGEVETDILASRPVPPSTADRALMVQPEDIAAAALFAATLPARACISDMTIVPTDNNFWRATAHGIAGS
jgi:NADP-dependent 3-hydroxy acid dehydrogenase YdfG